MSIRFEQPFPDLASFMGGWFHQDFDIDAFLATGDDGLDARFQAFFRPDVIPTAFRATTREFLEAIRAELVGAR